MQIGTAGTVGGTGTNAVRLPLACELKLAQLMVNQRRIPRARPGLLPLILPPNLVNQPAERRWTMQEVPDQIPGERADQVQIG